MLSSCSKELTTSTCGSQNDNMVFVISNLILWCYCNKDMTMISHSMHVRYFHSSQLYCIQTMYILTWQEYHSVTIPPRLCWATSQGHIYDANKYTPLLQESFRLSVKNLGFCAKLYWKKEKSLCFDEKNSKS